MSTTYPPPVDRLLTLGEEAAQTHPWPDYREMGVTEEHVPELIRMATDEELRWADSEGPEVWAPLHAWRALGQLRAEAAVEPLVSLLDSSEEDDWALNELPTVFGMIGRAAVPALSAYLADPAHPLWTRTAAVETLPKIVDTDDTAREEVVGVLTGQLEKWWRHTEEMNAFLISALVELGVTEAAPLMEQAFEAERVDVFMRGDWEDIQVELGLLPARLTPRPRFDPFGELPSLLQQKPESTATPRRGGQRKEKKKAKRKLARESRKRNRRRK